MDRKEIIQKIMKKREFSQLPMKDVEIAFSHFEKRQVSDEEKIRLTKELLHKVFSSFGSKKLLSPKDKDEQWILRKHLSTRERLPYYQELYSRLLDGEKIIFDLGAGINGFSYSYLEGRKYIAVEAVKQWVDLMNSYFEKEKLNAKAIHLSLFELEKLKKLIKKEKGRKIIFLFKTIDCLEMMERNFSKKLLLGVGSAVDKIVISFATESMGARKKFSVNRNWILNFIKQDFKILDDFQLGPERYLVFCKK